MIIHCTAALSSKLPSIASHAAADESPLGAWHAHLVRVQRLQCLLFCHDATRFMLMLPGVRKPQLQEIGRSHRDLFCAVLAAEGLPDALIARAEASLGEAGCDRATDRSVLGSMNIAMPDLNASISLNERESWMTRSRCHAG